MQHENKEGFPWKIIIFSSTLIVGLLISQIAWAMMGYHAKYIWEEVVGFITMTCLCFIMVNIGYEFSIDTSKLVSYAEDMVMAVGAAGLPWICIAIYYMSCITQTVSWPQALLAARFAAPTSAGILLSMLEAAGLKETWLFQKARILAIFDDLDTIILMIPLKAVVVGFRWELLVELVWTIALLALALWKLHAVNLPHRWYWTLMYAVLITGFVENLFYMTDYHLPMQPIHLEVLLPAFALGCLVHVNEGEEGTETSAAGGEASAESSCSAKASTLFTDEHMKTAISTVFMLSVGLSMPSLFGGKEGAQTSAGELVGHVVAVTLLMLAGKMFLCLFYRQEADWRARVALGLGMCLRGEVGTGVIVTSISLGIKGSVVTVSVACLVLNLIFSGGFIMGVKYMARTSAMRLQSEKSLGVCPSTEMADKVPNDNAVNPPAVLGRTELR